MVLEDTVVESANAKFSDCQGNLVQDSSNER